MQKILLQNCKYHQIWTRCTQYCMHVSSSKQKHTHARPDWNKAVSDAEKIVGYPTSFLSLRWLLSDEIANVALHLRKLVGSSHPLLKTAKNLLYTGSNNMQAWGLIVLLISKTVGYSSSISEVDQDNSAGVLHSQRALAEVTEMIRTSHLIHKGLINIYPGLYSEQHVLDDMTFGNKIALLSGDYLLSNSCAELAALKNQHLVELMSGAVKDLAQSEFIGRQDTQNNPLPPINLGIVRTNVSNSNECHDKDTLYNGRSVQEIIDNLDLISNDSQDIDLLFETHSKTVEDWTDRNLLLGASLLGKSCKGALLLAGHGERIQELGYDFGKHLALSWQAFVELETFEHYSLQHQPQSDTMTHNPSPLSNETFSLVCAPVLFHLEYSPEASRMTLSREIEKGNESVFNVNLRVVHEQVCNGPGIKLTKLLKHYHSTKALNVLLQFGNSDARNALIKIIEVMGNI